MYLIMYKILFKPNKLQTTINYMRGDVVEWLEAVCNGAEYRGRELSSGHDLKTVATHQ